MKALWQGARLELGGDRPLCSSANSASHALREEIMGGAARTERVGATAAANVKADKIARRARKTDALRPVSPMTAGFIGQVARVPLQRLSKQRHGSRFGCLPKIEHKCRKPVAQFGPQLC
jgi:hypothetical protein